MSIQTELLKLFGYEARDGESTFNLDLALNENWKKIDDYLKGVLLSDMSNANEATLQAAVKAIVLKMVANNLTTTAADLLLDARQGKELSDMLKEHLRNKKNPHGVTPEQIGIVYGTCTTAAATTAKVVAASNFGKLSTGAIVSVKFTHAVPAGATMNVNSTGAKKIFYQGSAIIAGVIRAKSQALFQYDGAQWCLLCVDKSPDIEVMTYVGTGTAGSPNPNTLTFNREPQLVFIGTNTFVGGVVKIIARRRTWAGTLNEPEDGSTLKRGYWTVTWSNEYKTVSWYDYRCNATLQANQSGVTYYAIAIYGEA